MSLGSVTAKRKPTEPVLLLPKRQRGRQSVESEADYKKRVGNFCALIRQIQSTMDFRVGSRGWCYILEPHGLRKGDFDDAERLITNCRKSGALPLDICAADETRATIGVQGDLDNPDVEAEADDWIDFLRNRAWKNHTPVGFWDNQSVFVQVVVEKLDLRNLFAPVCAEFFVPITNFKGWSDLNARADVMRLFAKHERGGRKCVLLVCGDHDRGGLLITESLRNNLDDLSGAVGWAPDNLIITRFGLNADFIDRHGLTWIDNLETSSGLQLDDPNHNDYDKSYVQDYIRRFGARKCEANALVVAPEIGRQLCRNAILQHVPANAAAAYARKLKRERDRLRREIAIRLADAGDTP
jgi:hypothetical protein